MHAFSVFGIMRYHVQLGLLSRLSHPPLAADDMQDLLLDPKPLDAQQCLPPWLLSLTTAVPSRGLSLTRLMLMHCSSSSGPPAERTGCPTGGGTHNRGSCGAGSGNSWGVIEPQLMVLEEPLLTVPKGQLLVDLTPSPATGGPWRSPVDGASSVPQMLQGTSRGADHSSSSREGLVGMDPLLASFWKQAMGGGLQAGEGQVGQPRGYGTTGHSSEQVDGPASAAAADNEAAAPAAPAGDDAAADDEGSELLLKEGGPSSEAMQARLLPVLRDIGLLQLLLGSCLHIHSQIRSEVGSSSAAAASETEEMGGNATTTVSAAASVLDLLLLSTSVRLDPPLGADGPREAPRVPLPRGLPSESMELPVLPSLCSIPSLAERLPAKLMAACSSALGLTATSSVVADSAALQPIPIVPPLLLVPPPGGCQGKSAGLRSLDDIIALDLALNDDGCPTLPPVTMPPEEEALLQHQKQSQQQQQQGARHTHQAQSQPLPPGLFEGRRTLFLPCVTAVGRNGTAVLFSPPAESSSSGLELYLDWSLLGGLMPSSSHAATTAGGTGRRSGGGAAHSAEQLQAALGGTAGLSSLRPRREGEPPPSSCVDHASVRPLHPVPLSPSATSKAGLVAVLPPRVAADMLTVQPGGHHQPPHPSRNRVSGNSTAAGTRRCLSSGGGRAGAPCLRAVSIGSILSTGMAEDRDRQRALWTEELGKWQRQKPCLGGSFGGLRSVVGAAVRLQQGAGLPHPATRGVIREREQPGGGGGETGQTGALLQPVPDPAEPDPPAATAAAGLRKRAMRPWEEGCSQAAAPPRSAAEANAASLLKDGGDCGLNGSSSPDASFRQEQAPPPPPPPRSSSSLAAMAQPQEAALGPSIAAATAATILGTPAIGGNPISLPQRTAAAPLSVQRAAPAAARSAAEEYFLRQKGAVRDDPTALPVSDPAAGARPASGLIGARSAGDPIGVRPVRGPTALPVSDTAAGARPMSGLIGARPVSDPAAGSRSVRGPTAQPVDAPAGIWPVGDLGGGAADAAGPSRAAVPAVSPPAISPRAAPRCQTILVPLPQSHLDLLAGLKACEEAVLERIGQLLLPHISCEAPLPRVTYESSQLQPRGDAAGSLGLDVPSEQVRASSECMAHLSG